MSNLILFGQKNCGKSYWGKKLAESSGRCLLETDALIEALFAEKYGTHLVRSEIYKNFGKKVFRALEAEAVSTLKQSQRCIISTGGGTLMDSQNLKLLHKIGTLVYLKEEKLVLKKRMLNQPIPAYFNGKDPLSMFESIFSDRESYFSSIIAVVIDLTASEAQIMKQLQGLLHG